MCTTAPATNKPVIAPDLKAIVKPSCKLFLDASAVLTLALTEISMPTYPATPDKNAPRVAWSYSKRLDLNGENVGWNYLTADFFKSYKAAMQARANTPAYSKDLLQAFKSRKLVKSEMAGKLMSLR